VAREVWEDKTVRHDAHKEGWLRHYQHANGGRGHAFYQSMSYLSLGFETKTFVGRLGDNWATQAADFLNPMSDFSELTGFGADLFQPNESAKPCETKK
jgi:hypothetical protein